MQIRYVGLLLTIFSTQLAQEKDYTLVDYGALSSDHQWRVCHSEKVRVENVLSKNDALDPRPYLRAAQINPMIAIELVLSGLKTARLDYTPDKKLGAYKVAQYAMLMARVLDVMPMSVVDISKSQIHRAWRSNNKDVSRMMALCRKHPGDRTHIIENFKRDLRYRLTRTLAQ